MSLPTEEDVLDVLLTWFLVFCVVNPRGEKADQHPDSWSAEVPQVPWEVALERLGDGGEAETLAAIADSERRLASNFAHPADVPSRPSKAEKRERRAAIRENCLKRADGQCECGCGQDVTDFEDTGVFLASAAQLDHFFGRGKGRVPETVETCWILRADHHREKTENRPDAATWFRKFMEHCDRHGFANWRREAHRRLGFVIVRASLPSAPRVRTNNG